MAEAELEIISTADNRGLVSAQREVDKLRGATDALGKEFKETSGDLAELDDKITKTKQSIRQLGAEFAKTQGPTLRTDLRAQRSLLTELEKIRKEMAEQSSPVGATIGAALGGNAGAKAADSFTKSFGESMRSGGRLMMYAKIAAVLSPLLVPLAAMTAGAVLGAVGGGGIIGGILLASRDSRVKAAWKDFGKGALSDLDAAAVPFIGATIQGIEILRDTWQSIQPEMKAIFAAFAQGVEPLMEGIAGFIREAIPGFRAAGRTIGPIIDVLKEDLPELSEDISAFFQHLEGGSEGAAQGLHDLITFLGNAIRTIGFLMEGASRWWEKIRHEPWRLLPVAMPITGFQILADQIRDLDAMQDAGAVSAAAFTTGLEAAAKVAGASSSGIQGQTRSFFDLRREIMLVSEAYGEFIGIQLSQDEADVRVKQSLMEFKKTLRETGYDFRDTTEAGLANQAMVLGLIRDFDAQRQAHSTNAETAKAATAEFWKQVDSLSAIGGKSKDAKKFLDDLAGKYEIKIMWEQVGQAVAQAGQWIAGQFKKVFGGFQAGGTTPAFEPFRVHAGEVMWSNKQHYVSSKAQTQKLAAMSGGGGAGGGPGRAAPIVVTDPFAATFLEMIKREVRRRGGELAVLGLKPV